MPFPVGVGSFDVVEAEEAESLENGGPLFRDGNVQQPLNRVRLSLSECTEEAAGDVTLEIVG